MLKLITFILCTFITATAQQQAFDVNAANPQRTRVLNTQGLKAPPHEVLWKSERLFELRNSNWIASYSGPLSLYADLPTPQGFSVPVVAGDYLYFSFGDINSYVFAVEKSSGKKTAGRVAAGGG